MTMKFQISFLLLHQGVILQPFRRYNLSCICKDTIKNIYKEYLVFEQAFYISWKQLTQPLLLYNFFNSVLFLFKDRCYICQFQMIREMLLTGKFIVLDIFLMRCTIVLHIFDTIMRNVLKSTAFLLSKLSILFKFVFSAQEKSKTSLQQRHQT